MERHGLKGTSLSLLLGTPPLLSVRAQGPGERCSRPLRKPALPPGGSVLRAGMRDPHPVGKGTRGPATGSWNGLKGTSKDLGRKPLMGLGFSGQESGSRLNTQPKAGSHRSHSW